MSCRDQLIRNFAKTAVCFVFMSLAIIKLQFLVKEPAGANLTYVLKVPLLIVL